MYDRWGSSLSSSDLSVWVLVSGLYHDALGYDHIAQWTLVRFVVGKPIRSISTLNSGVRIPLLEGFGTRHHWWWTVKTVDQHGLLFCVITDFELFVYTLFSCKWTTLSLEDTWCVIARSCHFKRRTRKVRDKFYDFIRLSCQVDGSDTCEWTILPSFPRVSRDGFLRFPLSHKEIAAWLIQVFCIYRFNLSIALTKRLHHVWSDWKWTRSV